jgi:3-hydroxyisobutyrate dehydrogenase-like beta-hydroxyacid dehydrogenase
VIPETAIERVGFIGVGNQGAPMVRHIIDGGFPTTLWARSPEKIEIFSDSARIAPSKAALARECDLIEICVWDEEGVRDVLLGSNGLFTAMRPGSIVAIHSTISPEAVQSLGQEADEKHVILLDAPVSGAPITSEAGELLVMVGGPEQAFEACRPIFSTFGRNILHLGPRGNAARAKLVNNLLFNAVGNLTRDALELGEVLGLNRKQTGQVLVHGSAGSATRIAVDGDRPVGKQPARFEAIRQRRFEYAQKDVDLARQAARLANTDVGDRLFSVAAPKRS